MSASGVLRLACVLPLPAPYRAAEFLAFHRRDPQGVSERIDGDTLHKALLWRGRPARLEIRLCTGRAEVALEVDADAVAGVAGHVPDTAGLTDGLTDGLTSGHTAELAALSALARRMLGLDQDVETFERRYRGHPQLGPLIAARPGLRVPQAVTPFEALTWAVTGQQISVAVAVALRRRLILAAGVPHSSGLVCPPDAAGIAALSDADLRAAGFSTAKTATLRVLAREVAGGTLPLAHWPCALPVDELRARLLAIRGVGPWTVHYTLLRGLGWLDGSLHGDVAVRGALQALLDVPERIDEKRARTWLEPFSPWRALVAAHLWASRTAVAY